MESYKLVSFPCIEFSYWKIALNLFSHTAKAAAKDEGPDPCLPRVPLAPSPTMPVPTICVPAPPLACPMPTHHLILLLPILPTIYLLQQQLWLLAVSGGGPSSDRSISSRSGFVIARIVAEDKCGGEQSSHTLNPAS